MSGDAYGAFERDIPEALQEDAMQMMAEAAHDDDAHACVTILERDRLDAINVRVSGIIEVNGTEYTFQLEDGNRKGTELLAWENDRPFEHHVPTTWALQPNDMLVDRALLDGKGPFLIFKWDALLKNRPELAEVPRKYGYDRYFAPGGRTERHWREEAAKHQFEIVTSEQAQSTRDRLAAATGGAA